MGSAGDIVLRAMPPTWLVGLSSFGATTLNFEGGGASFGATTLNFEGGGAFLDSPGRFLGPK